MPMKLALHKSINWQKCQMTTIDFNIICPKSTMLLISILHIHSYINTFQCIFVCVILHQVRKAGKVFVNFEG